MLSRQVYQFLTLVEDSEEEKYEEEIDRLFQCLDASSSSSSSSSSKKKSKKRGKAENRKTPKVHRNRKQEYSEK